MVFECMWLSKETVRWCFSATGCRKYGTPWRHHLSALAAAGFHAVAPDMRGYGQTDRFLPSMRSADARRSHLDNNSGSRNKKSRLFKVLSSNSSQLNIFGWTIR
jgi:hypothetical protein